MHDEQTVESIREATRRDRRRANGVRVLVAVGLIVFAVVCITLGQSGPLFAKWPWQ